MKNDVKLWELFVWSLCLIVVIGIGWTMQMDSTCELKTEVAVLREAQGTMFGIGNYLQANNIKLPEDICEKYFGHRWEEGRTNYITFVGYNRDDKPFLITEELCTRTVVYGDTVNYEENNGLYFNYEPHKKYRRCKICGKVQFLSEEHKSEWIDK